MNAIKTLIGGVLIYAGLNAFRLQSTVDFVYEWALLVAIGACLLVSGFRGFVKPRRTEP